MTIVTEITISSASGVIFASTISSASAGVISSCSIVPDSFSRIIVPAAMSEQLRIICRPKTPVTINHELTSPGIVEKGHVRNHRRRWPPPHHARQPYNRKAARSRVLVKPRHGSLGVALRDLRCVRVHRVQQDLYDRRLTAQSLLREIARNHDANIKPARDEILFQCRLRCVEARHHKRLRARKHGDQLPALLRLAVVGHAQLQPANIGRQRISRTAESSALAERSAKPSTSCRGESDVVPSSSATAAALARHSEPCSCRHLHAPQLKPRHYEKGCTQQRNHQQMRQRCPPCRTA